MLERVNGKLASSVMADLNMQNSWTKVIIIESTGARIGRGLSNCKVDIYTHESAEALFVTHLETAE